MSLSFTPAQNFRFERKFTTQGTDRTQLFLEIKKHPALFSEIFHPRHINNIYFDTQNLKYYYDNVDGVSVRKKVRIRWYGERWGALGNPRLEYKLKNNLVGDKWSFPLPDFELHQQAKAPNFKQIFSQAALPPEIQEDLSILRPTLLNSYRRTYFQSADKNFRLTFDEDMSYHAFRAGSQQFAVSHPAVEPGRYIIELKYATDHDHRANQIAKQFSFRLDKSSKYVSGLELTK